LRIKGEAIAIDVEIDVELLKSDMKTSRLRFGGAGERLHLPDRARVG
jgi:hypothetical protein